MKRLGVGLVILITFLTSALPVSADTINPPSATAGWLETLNYYRLSSGMPIVTEDPAITEASKKHATYLARSDKKYFSGIYENLHSENPASPFYSKEGVEVGAGNIVSGAELPSRAIDSLMAAPFHANGFLRENLERVGFGTEVIGPNGYSPGMRVTNIGVIAGLNNSVRTKVILFPGSGAITYLNDFDSENPEPRESCGSDYKKYKGLIIFASLLTTPSKLITASLTDPKNKKLSSNDLCLVTEHNFKSSDPIYGEAGRGIISQDHLVMLIPRNPLMPGKYKVEIKQAELEDLKWEFTYVEGLQRLPNTVSVTYPRSNKKVFVGDKVVIKVESMDAKIYSSISNSLVCAGKWDKNLLVITTKKSGTCTVTVTGSQTNFLKAFKEKYVISVQGKR